MRKESSNSEIFPGLDTSFPLIVIYPKNHNPHIDIFTQSRHEPVLAKFKLDAPLPKPSFQLLDHPPTYGSTFVRPNTYIQYVEPTTEDTYNSVEYDMDEEDQFWLTTINERRKIESKVGPVSASLFELIMDRLEKEWSNQVKLHKNLYIEDHVYPSPEESKCAVCNDSECENSNAIVFCDGCNLAVHQDCYGIPYIPEGQWLCRRCLLAPDKILKCVLCPNQGGALKQTVDNRWAHILCAYWIPEAGFANPVYMEPIDGISNIPRARWKLQCYICRKRQGACIQCAHKKCFTSFHVTCARKLGLPLPMKMGESVAIDSVDLKAYCHRHVPRDSFSKKTHGSTAIPNRELRWSNLRQSQNDEKSESLSIDDSSSNNQDDEDIDEKTQEAKDVLELETPKSSMPYVSTQIYEVLTRILRSYSIANKSSFLNSICAYWTLKRRSRRGAPLLKRLIFQSYSPVITSENHVDVNSLRSIQGDTVRYLRQDLERVRILAELVRRRERLKSVTLEAKRDLFRTVFFPLDGILYKLWKILKS